MGHVTCRYGIPVFGFDGNKGIRDHSLEDRRVRPVTGEKGFIRKDDNGIPQVSVEVPRQVPGIGYIDKMLPKKSTVKVGDRTLSRAAATLKNESHFSLTSRVLYSPCHPVDHVFIEVVVAGADYPFDVIPQKGPVTFLRLQCKSLPQVYRISGKVLTRREDNPTKKLPAGPVFEPCIGFCFPYGVSFLGLASPDAVVEVGFPQVFKGDLLKEVSVENRVICRPVDERLSTFVDDHVAFIHRLYPVIAKLFATTQSQALTYLVNDTRC